MNKNTEESARIRRQRKKAKALFDERCGAESLVEICEKVINGGSLIKICVGWDVMYSDAIRWIYADDQRKKQYEEALEARAEWTKQRILDELKDIAFVDVRESLDKDGNLKPLKDLPDSVAHAISSIEILEEWEGRGENKTFIGLTKKVKFVEKTRAIELAGKTLKMFVDQVEHKHSMKLEDLVNGSYEDDPKKEA